MMTKLIKSRILSAYSNQCPIMSEVHQLLTSAVNYLVQQHCINDAVFLAELLHAEVGAADSAYLLATCYYQLKRVQEARYLLQSHTTNPQCALLYARCCLDLREFQAGLAQLQGLLCVGVTSEDSIVNKFGQDAGTAFYLLGQLNRKLHLSKEACRAYRLALKYNPFLWSAFESLCQLEKGVASTDCFKFTHVPTFLQGSQYYKIPDPSAATKPLSKPLNASIDKDCGMYVTPELFPIMGKAVASSTPASHVGFTTSFHGGVTIKPLSFDSEQSKLSPDQFSPQALNFTITPPSTQLPNEYSLTLSQAPPSMKSKNRSSTMSSITRTQEPLPLDNESTIIDTPSQPNIESSMDGINEPPSIQELHSPRSSYQLRRSARLGSVGKSPSSLAFSRHRTEMIPSPLTVARTKSRKTVTSNIANPATAVKKQRVVTFSSPLNVQKSPKKPHPLSVHSGDENRPQEEEIKEEEKMDTSLPQSQPLPEIKEVVKTALCTFLALLQNLGSAYSCLVNYQLKEATSQFQQLPLAYRNTPWVLTQLGQAMMAGEKFKEAAQYFSEVHQNNPHRQEGMDLYGSALWHLQKDTELALLAEELETSNKTQPQGLCVLASLMNYYKDHDTAIRYLERAIQVAPELPYPQTLLGLEYTLIKDYDKALVAFQSATNLDPHHVNAWYGLSHLYYQQEKWALAEMSVKRALSLNTHSSIAYTQLAMIQQRLGHSSNALMTIERAVACNSNNHLPKFHRALILESMGHCAESLKQLEELTVSLPKEPSFYKAMSRVLLKLGRPQDSVLRMAWSMDYSHSNGGLIAGMNLVRPQLRHNDVIDDLEGLNESDFIPHSDSSSVLED